jgi:hypothetical protein
VEATLDFTEAVNVKLEGTMRDEPNIAFARIKPLRSQTVAVLRAYDVEWTTTCRLKVHKRSPTIGEQKAIIKYELEKLEYEI